MSDEPTTDEPLEEPVQEVPEGPTPEELEARAKELADQEKALKKGFQEIAERERRISEAPKEDEPELDSKSQKLLDRYFESKYGDKLALSEKMYVELANLELDRFAADSGLDAEQLRSTVTSYGFIPEDMSIGAIRKVLDKAAKVMKSSDFDPESERERIRQEERETLVKQFAEQGHVIEGISPKRTEPDNSATLDDEDIAPEQKIELLKEKHSSWLKTLGR